jgi:predicted amidophosphoribosyltransferase
LSRISDALDYLVPLRSGTRALRRISAEEIMRRAERAERVGKDTFAMFAYRDPLARRLVWELKYHSSPRAVSLASEILAAALTEEIAERLLFEALSKPLIVPIPASPRRAQKRGGDPLALLARTLVSEMGHLAHSGVGVLEKRRDVAPQTEMASREERLLNVAGALTVRESAAVRGRDIIVLDDVTTTGATFREARRALRRAGAKKILCVALAH